MNNYELSIEEVFNKFKTSEEGLNNDEVKERLERDGFNSLKEAKKESKIVKFLKEFKDLMIIILLLSAIVSFVISLINNESFIDSIIIVAIVIINAILGFVQEMKADKAISSLKKMQVTKVKVKRNNKIFQIRSEEVVIGDILLLEAGDTVPADARIIWEASLKVDESALTGESVPAEKNVESLEGKIDLSERSNMIYSSTSVVYGKCRAVVTDVGMNTEIGKIAQSIETTKEELTPLQKQINGISKVLSLIIMIIIIIMFIVGIIRGINFVEILMLSISLAVAAIPEGLPTVITVVLSLGMSSLAEKKAIVRKMSSVETLGCTEIICSDKTGTITQNKMTIRELYFDDELHTEVKDHMLLNIMLLNNDVSKNGDNYIGDPTEIALYNYCEKYMDVKQFIKDHKRIDELPFDSDRKMMSTINKFENNKLLTKGSFDSVILKCNRILENNKIIKLTDKKKKELKQIEIEESNKAYRVLTYAYKDLDDNYKLDNSLEEDLIFVGMSAMIDPPRIDVKEAISICKSAKIKPVMITGDSLSTAVAIAKETGILQNESEAITGADVDALSEEELIRDVHKYSVYARVSPMNKVAIVNAWKANNKVVAMTGDGVNDAPALKTASIGVGMGITGTEVSKNVSDIVLADDSFSTIVSAVKEGRRIYDNIRNVLVYLLTGNIAEVLVVCICMMFGIEIFLPIQLLYINLVTDSIPAISLAFEKEADNVMSRPIRKKDSSFFTPFLVSRIVIPSLLKSLLIFIIYVFGINLYGEAIADTMCFLTLVILEMVFAFSCRNLNKNIINKNIFSNKILNMSMFGLFIIQLLVFTTPIRNIFGLTALNFSQFFICLILVLVVFINIELTKKMTSKKFRD